MSVKKNELSSAKVNDLISQNDRTLFRFVVFVRLSTIHLWQFKRFVVQEKCLSVQIAQVRSFEKQFKRDERKLQSLHHISSHLAMTETRLWSSE